MLAQSLSNGLTTIGLLAMILDTSPVIADAQHRLLTWLVVLVWFVIAADFVLRLRRIARGDELRAYLTSGDGLIDLISALALPVGWLVTSEPRDALLFALVWSLRYIRHTAGLALFWRVMQRSRTALLSIGSLFVAIFFAASALASSSSEMSSQRLLAVFPEQCGGRSLRSRRPVMATCCRRRYGAGSLRDG